MKLIRKFSSVAPRLRFARPMNNSVCHDRKVIEVDAPGNPERTITVSSYNILCRHYMWEKVYGHLPTDYRDWRNRLKLLNQNMQDLSTFCDIMCFQEMEYKMYINYWEKAMRERNFGSIFERKLSPAYWDRNLTMMDGVAIFYNQETFKLLNYERVEYADFFTNPIFFEQTKDIKERLGTRNNVALIATLQHIKTREVVFVANTHLYWSPRYEDVKLLQMYELSELIWKAARRYYQCPNEEIQARLEQKDGVNIILTGDLNSSPGSMVYRYLTQGELYLDKEPEMAPFNYGGSVRNHMTDRLGTFHSPYIDRYNEGLFTKTAYLPKFKKIIDYIWFNGFSTRLRPTKILDELTDEKTAEYLGFPNNEYPSDHLPIVTEFEVMPRGYRQ